MDAVLAGLHVAQVSRISARQYSTTVGALARWAAHCSLSWSKWSPRHNRFSKMDAYASSSSVLEQ